MKFRLLLLLATAHSASLSAQNLTVRFQPPSQPGGATLVSDWIELGLRFTTPSGVASNDSSNNLYPSNGTAYLQALSGQSPLTIAPTGLQPFSVSSIDLAEYSTPFAAPKSVTFLGTQVGGNTVSITFVTDGNIDGNGPTVDFQTFFFPATFSGLTKITVGTDTYSMDNLVFAIIPEPSALNLILLTCFAALAAKRYIKRQAQRR